MTAAVKIRQVRRASALIAAAVSVLAAAAGWIPGFWMWGAGAAGVFLYATDFGRQCPLLLTVRQAIAARRAAGEKE